VETLGIALHNGTGLLLFLASKQSAYYSDIGIHKRDIRKFVGIGSAWLCLVLKGMQRAHK
jgi:hypothetical protein